MQSIHHNSCNMCNSNPYFESACDAKMHQFRVFIQMLDIKLNTITKVHVSVATSYRSTVSVRHTLGSLAGQSCPPKAYKNPCKNQYQPRYAYSSLATVESIYLYVDHNIQQNDDMSYRLYHHIHITDYSKQQHQPMSA